MALALSAPAALASWSAPQTVSAPHDAISDLQLVSGVGDLLSWHYSDLVPPARQIFGAPGADYAEASYTGLFGPEHRLPASYATGPLVNLHGEGKVAQLILRRTGIDTAEPEVALGSASGVFASPQRIHASVWGGHASLAGNSRGEMLLAWISSPRAGQRQIWVSVRLAGKRFGAPRLIDANANGLLVTAAVGPPSHSADIGGCSCDMVVVFDSRRGRMLASVLPHGPHTWGPVQGIGPAARGAMNQATAYVGRDGRVIVTWYHEQISEGGPLGPGYTQVAVLAPGAHRFAPAQTLERDEPTATAGGQPAIVAEGGRILAFLAQPGTSVSGFTPAVVRVSYRTGNRFGVPQTISPPGQQASELAATSGPFAGGILTWTGTATSLPSPSPTYPSSVYAAVSNPVGTRLEAPQRVSTDERAAAAVATSVGPGWGVAWTNRSRYQSPLLPGPMVVRASFCYATCSSFGYGRARPEGRCPVRASRRGVPLSSRVA